MIYSSFHTVLPIFVILNFVLRSDGKFKDSRYNDVDITVTMPEGTDVCDIGTLTVWCQPFRAIFTRIEIPRSIFVSFTVLSEPSKCSLWFQQRILISNPTAGLVSIQYLVCYCKYWRNHWIIMIYCSYRIEPNAAKQF